MSEGAADAVDIVFALSGDAVPEDYPFALLREVARHLPWLESDPEAGIHPLRGARTDYGVLLLPRRARLVLRVRAARAEDTLALAGRALALGARTLRVGPGRVRALEPYGALYAHLVAGDAVDESDFLEGVAARLADLGAACKSVCGRRRRLRAGDREISGFGLMLHELAADQSLRVQRSGLGGERGLGCGVFVRHRLAAAVGAA